MVVASKDFILAIPKAELHLHIEGTLTPALKLRLAERNGLPKDDVYSARLTLADVADGSETTLADRFFELYYGGMQVLQKDIDFHDLTLAYLEHCSRVGIVYSEIFFDPQAHSSRGVPFEAVAEGIKAGQIEGEERYGVKSRLILSILRDKPLESAMETMRQARRYRDYFVGIGLDSDEDDHPPIKFKKVYDLARAEGYELTAHCGPDTRDVDENFRQCVWDLGVSRVDHGINIVEDPALMDAVRERNICMTSCPVWIEGDASPRGVRRIMKMLEEGLLVTVNTDDPAYFTSGFMDTALPEFARAGNVSEADFRRFVRNAFVGAWMPDDERSHYLSRLDGFLSA